ncbi:MAG: hypothetical protein P1Q69_05830 [Candidatus Thorarchaeota archaeon]|nr:hypothetical protein [Candidatus Thorarchaeota archaeon]
MNNPMRIKLLSLTLNCKGGNIPVSLNRHISFFHGKISSGKSTIPRLINFCFGSDLSRTRAIDDELNSVQLSAILGENETLFEREVGSSQIRITWKGPSGNGSVLSPAKGVKNTPIWNHDVYGLSDLIFHLFGMPSMKVQFGASKTDSTLIRLSFRDIFHFCYLNQEEMISSFFRLNEPVLMVKSRTVMRFIIGDLTEKLAGLEAKRIEFIEDNKEKERKAKDLRNFLSKFGYDDETEISERVEKLNDDKQTIQKSLENIREEYSEKPHLVDELRDELRQLATKLQLEEKALDDLEDSILRKQKLKDEIISTRIANTRRAAASRVLSDAHYSLCPMCGLKIRSKPDHIEETCLLCGRFPTDNETEKSVNYEDIQTEFGERIDELAEAIERHKEAFIEQKENVRILSMERSKLESKLDRRFDEYDPRLIARTRQLEHEMGTIEERISGLSEGMRMVQEVAELEKGASRLLADIDETERAITEEREKNKRVEKYVKEIEQTYLDALLEVGLPGVTDSDQVELNRVSWIPKILPGGDRNKAWDFGSAGSAGKKTLMKTCYALSLHKVASSNMLPLPTLLVIDAPMDHIDKTVNQEIFERFYKYLYNTAQSNLTETQFIIIDQDYVIPDFEGLNIKERKMTPDEEKYPPLIEYYRETARNESE